MSARLPDARQPGRWWLVVNPHRQDSTIQVFAEGLAPDVEVHDGPLTVALAGIATSAGGSGRWHASQLADRLAGAKEGETLSFLSGLRGAFALITWDRASATMCCVRDPMGMHPLYWARAGTALVVSPWMDGPLRHPGVPRNVDPTIALAHVLSVSSRPYETLFAAVRRVPAGCLLEAGDRGDSLRRYWNPLSHTRGGDAGSRFAAALGDAVSRAAKRGRIGVFLSGGLDSATVAAAAREVSRSAGLPPPVGLSIVFSDTRADESSTQRRIAAELGLASVMMPLAELTRGALLTTAVHGAASAPYPPGLLQPAYRRLAQLGEREGCRTILTGDGGDEWLLPPRTYAADRLMSGDFLALWELARAWYWYAPEATVGSVATGVLWRWGVRPIARAQAARALARWSPTAVRRVRRDSVLGGLPAWVAPEAGLRERFLDWALEVTPEVTARSAFARDRRALLDDIFSSWTMEQAFDEARRFGVPIEMPLLDPDVVTMTVSVDPARLVRGGRAKALAVELLARDVPWAPHWPRTVYGDSIWESAVAREGLEAFELVDGVRLLDSLGVVDADLMRRLLRERSPSARSDAALIERAITLDAWLRPRV